MLEEPNELSSDLEWMLESGQADREMLLDALLQEHYIPVYRLSLAMLGEMVAAHQAAMQTIGLALMDYPPRRGRLQLKPWLYGHAMRSINRLISGKPRVEPATPSSASIEFCEVFATYGLKERYALTFRYLLNWEAEDIAALLRVNEHAVQVQLDLSRGRLFDALKGEIGAAPAPLAGLSDEQIRANEGAYQDSHLAETFRSCWPAPDLSETDWQRIRTQVEDFPALKLPFWQHFPGWREPVLILMTILIIISLGLGLGIILGERILPEFSIFSPDRTPSIQPIGMVERQFPPEGEAQAYLYRVLAGDDLASVSLALDLPQESLLELNEIYSDTQLVPGQGLVVVPYAVNHPPPTVVPPAPRGRQLNMRDNSSTITQVIHSSAGYWNTLWIDAQSVDYGPVGYIGAPRIYRAQTWVDQPAQSSRIVRATGRRPEQSAIDKRWKAISDEPG